jgi:hypothetical protein
MAKQSSNALSRLASRIMTGAEATRQDIMQLAASVLSQDETKGTRKKRKAKKSKSAAKKRKAKKSKSAATKRAAKKRK